MKCKLTLTLAALLFGFSATVSAQPWPPPPDPGVIHYPILNWDFFNPPTSATDLHIVVETDNFIPSDVYVDPNIPGWQYDGQGPGPSGGTALSWSTNAGPLPSVVHVGADLAGAGRVTGAYWTEGGQPIGSIPIVWELTWVDPWDLQNPSEPGAIWMRLQSADSLFGNNSPQGGDQVHAMVQLANIRTYSDIPAGVLGLNDINASLNELELVSHNPSVRIGTSIPGPVSLPGQNGATDSFFDVFVNFSELTNPSYQSLLVAEVLVAGQRIGTFWNLNYQSPEPSTMVLLALGGLSLIRRRRR